MSNIYSSVEVLKFPRSRFKFRTTRRATYGYGKIYPDFYVIVLLVKLYK